VFVAGHAVAMVTYCVTKMITTSSPVIGQFFEIMMIMTHQNLTAGNYFEPP